MESGIAGFAEKSRVEKSRSFVVVVAVVVVVVGAVVVVVGNSLRKSLGRNFRHRVQEYLGQNFRHRVPTHSSQFLWTFDTSSMGLESDLSSPCQMATWTCDFFASP